MMLFLLFFRNGISKRRPPSSSPQSGFYDDPVPGDPDTTEGELILERFGFTFQGEAFQYVWVWYTVFFSIGLCILSILTSVYCLNHIRFATGGGMGGIEHEEENDGAEENIGSTTEDSTLKTIGATLTFKDVNYVVTASTSNEKLHLLKGISGYFAAGKMTALMGSSGGMIDDMLLITYMQPFSLLTPNFSFINIPKLGKLR